MSFGDFKECATCMTDHSCCPTYTFSRPENCEQYKGLSKPIYKWRTAVELRAQLKPYISLIVDFDKRDCFAQIEKFLNGKTEARVCALYGLRRTGKSTLLYQVIAQSDLATTAYIRLRDIDEMLSLYVDLDVLFNLGIRTVLIDEVTMAPDFVTMSNVLADNYAARGMKIILAGTDSLGLYLASLNRLYDRVQLIHTTFISFPEYSRLLHKEDFDAYLQYGGTLSPEGEIPFKNTTNALYYYNTAIVDNIQNSLRVLDHRYYSYSNLREIYFKYGLTDLINRIVDDTNHEFLVEILNRKFESHALGSVKDIVAQHGSTALKNYMLDNEAKVLSKFREYLCVSDTKSFEYSEKALQELKLYLKELDVLSFYKVISADTSNVACTALTHHIFTQPGLQYAQAKSLVLSFLNQSSINELNSAEQQMLLKSILTDAAGRILEDSVINHTKIALGARDNDMSSRFQVFQFKCFDNRRPVGEYDMVVEDLETGCSHIFEIKHSSEKVSTQTKHLLNDTISAVYERLHYPIKTRTVLYMGNSDNSEQAVIYKNTPEYLANISQHLTQRH